MKSKFKMIDQKNNQKSCKNEFLSNYLNFSRVKNQGLNVIIVART